MSTSAGVKFWTSYTGNRIWSLSERTSSHGSSSRSTSALNTKSMDMVMRSPSNHLPARHKRVTPSFSALHEHAKSSSRTLTLDSAYTCGENIANCTAALSDGVTRRRRPRQTDGIHKP